MGLLDTFRGIFTADPAVENPPQPEPIQDKINAHAKVLSEAGLSQEDYDTQIAEYADAMNDLREHEITDFKEAHPELPYEAKDFGYNAEALSNGTYVVENLDTAKETYVALSRVFEDELFDVENVDVALARAFPDMPEELRAPMASNLQELGHVVEQEIKATALAEKQAGIDEQTLEPAPDLERLREGVVAQFDGPPNEYSTFEALVVNENNPEEAAKAFLVLYSLFGNDDLTSEELTIAEAVLPDYLAANYAKMDSALRQMPNYDVPRLEATPEDHARHEEAIHSMRSMLYLGATTFSNDQPELRLAMLDAKNDIAETAFLNANPDLPYSVNDYGYDGLPEDGYYVIDIDKASAVRTHIEEAFGKDLSEVEDVDAALHGSFPDMPEHIRSEMSQHLSGLVEGMDNYNAELGAHHITWVAATLGQQNRQLSDDQAETIQRMLPAAIHNAVGKEGAEQLQRGEYGALSGILNDPLDQIDVAQHYLKISAQAENKPELDIKAKELLTERAQINVDRNQSKSFSMGKSLSKDDDMGL